MQKFTFSMCFLRCSGILNCCANYVHTDSGKTSKIPRKSIHFLELSECLIKISAPASTKTVNSRNLYFMFS